MQRDAILEASHAYQFRTPDRDGVRKLQQPVCEAARMPKLGLINYGSGNYASVYNALEHLGHAPFEITAPKQMNSASHLIVPGVGAFPTAMQKLQQLDLVDELRTQVLDRQKPYLGICVGMQILADVGFEFEECNGLGLIPGSVQALSVGADLPVPHMGWNDLQTHRECPLLQKMPEPSSFYFVHSFEFNANSPDVTTASCNYGTSITACVQQDNIFGVQFHPEKSQRHGLQLLENFASL